MRTDSDTAALALLDFTTPSAYDLSSRCRLSSADDLPSVDEVPDYPWAPAWSSSPLGDPTVDDAYLVSDGSGPGAWRPGSAFGLVIGATVLGALGVGAMFGIAVLDFAGAASATQTVAVTGAQFATPQSVGRYPSMTITVPTPAVPPMPTTLPVSEFPLTQPAPTVRVLPCDPQPFCV